MPQAKKTRTIAASCDDHPRAAPGHARRRRAARPDDARRRERSARRDPAARRLGAGRRGQAGDRRRRRRVPDRGLRRSHRGAGRLPAQRPRRRRAAPRARLRAPQREPQDGARGGRRRSSTSTASRPAPGSASSSARSSARERQVRRGGVLLQPRAALRARDRDDVVALRQQPGERDLRRRRVAALGDGLHASRRAPGSRPSPRAGSAGCSCGSRRRRTSAAASVPVRKPRPSGANGRNAAPLAAHHGIDLGERVARPQRRLGLHATRRGGSRARARALLDARPRTARARRPCPARPARPSRPRSPRAAPRDRRGAAGRGR